MDAVLAKVIAALEAKGGKTTYTEVFNSLNFQEQQLLPRAINLGKSNGTLKQYLAWDEETRKSSHVLEVVTA